MLVERPKRPCRRRADLFNEGQQVLEKEYQGLSIASRREAGTRFITDRVEEAYELARSRTGWRRWL